MAGPPPPLTQLHVSNRRRGTSGAKILRWRTLGDKLQWLADQRPAYVTALERLVDQLIRHVRKGL